MRGFNRVFNSTHCSGYNLRVFRQIIPGWHKTYADKRHSQDRGKDDITNAQKPGLTSLFKQRAPKYFESAKSALMGFYELESHSEATPILLRPQDTFNLCNGPRKMNKRRKNGPSLKNAAIHKTVIST